MPLTDPVPSSAFDVLERNVQDADKFVNQETGTFTNRVGKQVKPIPVIEAEVLEIVRSIGWDPVGEFATGFTYTKLNDVGRDSSGSWWRYNGSDLPKIITAGTVPSSPSFSVISFETADNVQWEIGKSVGHSLDDLQGFTDELYSQAGTVDSGLPDVLGNSQRVESLNKLFNKNFDSIQLMLASTTLKLGQKLKTGATTWKAVSSTKGWDTATSGVYVIPLNGVYVDDAGADPLGVNDSYSAIMYVINKYNADTKLRFAVNFSSGYYKTSAEVAMHGLTSGIKLKFNLARVEATADMNALISCPAISGLTLVDIEVSHAVGVTISEAMIHINNEENANKTTRHKIGGITAGLVTGAPCVLLADKMWESKIGRIRVDRDVTGMTGDIVVLRSCVNVAVSPSEIGYCETAWRLGIQPNVSYGCEGITFNGGVTTFAKIPIAIDRGTAIRIIGMVLDFCETSGPTFSNGADVTMTNCWIANTATSAAGWNGFISISVTTGAKISGNHFVNNSPNAAYCALINSTISTFTDNTSDGCLPGFRRLNEVTEYGNSGDIHGVWANDFKGTALILNCDDGVAGSIGIRSGKTSSAPGQLLSRFEFSAPKLNSSNSFQIDHYQGAFSDIPEIKMSWNGTQLYGLEAASGNIRLYAAGSGIILKSPDGLITKTLTISNAGVITLI